MCVCGVQTSAVARIASSAALSLLSSAAARLSCCFIWPSRARASAPHTFTLSDRADRDRDKDREDTCVNATEKDNDTLKDNHQRAWFPDRFNI